jgi:hypothetical protein
VGVERKNRIHGPRTKAKAAGVGFHKKEIAPRIAPHPLCGTGEHGRTRVQAEDTSPRADRALEKPEAETGPTPQVKDRLTGAKLQQVDGPGPEPLEGPQIEAIVEQGIPAIPRPDRIELCCQWRLM